MIQHAHGEAWELVLVVYLIKICCWFYVLLVYARLVRDECIAGDPDSTLTVVVYGAERGK